MNDLTTPLHKHASVLLKVLEEASEVIYIGNPILRTPSTEVSLEEGKEVAEKLKKVITKYRSITGFGRGIAAPQIGFNRSVFITFIDDKVNVFINPHVVEKSKETNFYKELCMSSGILAADVERPEWIVIEWTDEEGKMHKEKVDGFLARLYQHEEAHLRGIVNLDEAAPQGVELVTFNPFEEKLRKVR